MLKPSAALEPSGRWRWDLTSLLYASLLAALAYYVQQIDFARFFSSKIDWGLLAAAAALAAIVKCLYPLVWRIILRGMQVPVADTAELYRIYAASWLGRYTPGKAAMIGARALYAERLGARRSEALVSFAVEQALQIGVGAAIGLILLFISDMIALPDWMLQAALLVVAGCLIALSPPVLHRMLSWGWRLLGRAAPDAFPAGGAIVSAAGLQAVIQIGYGAYTTLAVLALVSDQTISFAMGAAIWGSFTLALVGGMFVVIAPAGLGAREVLQFALLSPVLPPESLALLILGHRIVELASDIAFFSCGQIAPAARNAFRNNF
jgi:glycosyltransferase 2 family protein